MLNNQKVYSIYYWVNKKFESATYYYPGINEEETNKVFCFIICRCQILFKRFIKFYLDTEFLTPANLLNILDLEISTYSLYIYSFTTCIF